nr:hypothetical protein [Rhodopirellula sp. SM50]
MTRRAVLRQNRTDLFVEIDRALGLDPIGTANQDDQQEDSDPPTGPTGFPKRLRNAGIGIYTS